MYTKEPAAPADRAITSSPSTRQTMSSITRILLCDVQPEQSVQYINTTLKYRNIVTNILSVLMLPAPEFIFMNGMPKLKGCQCACVTIEQWADSEAAYEVVSELQKFSQSTIPHIGGVWTVKSIGEPCVQLLRYMAGDASFILDNNEVDDATFSDTEMDNEFEDEIVEIDDETRLWKTVSADGTEVITSNQKLPEGWVYDAPSPIPEPPKLMRWSPPCCNASECDLCIPLEQVQDLSYYKYDKLPNIQYIYELINS